MFTAEEIKKYRCKRWNELPDVELYMDQVIVVLEKSLLIFAENTETKIITPAMINNYVKQKIVKPPKNKKYDRVHLAYLFVACILKKFMSISEICDGMEIILKRYKISEAYDIFCDEFEKMLSKAFFDEKADETKSENDEMRIIKAVSLSASYYLYAAYLISLNEIKLSEEKKQ